MNQSVNDEGDTPHSRGLHETFDVDVDNAGVTGVTGSHGCSRKKDISAGDARDALDPTATVRAP